MKRIVRLGIMRHVEAERCNGVGEPTANRFRFHRDGRVSAHGRMPSSDVIGWWFVGLASNLLGEIHDAVRECDRDKQEGVG